MMNKVKAGIAAAVVLAAVPAMAAQGSLAERISSRLEKAGVTAQGDVSVVTNGDRAVLEGAVTSVAASRAAEKAARKETKVVENRLRILPAVERSDAELEKDVRKAILRSPNYGVFDSVGVTIEDGVVLIQGSVRMGYRKNDIVDRVAKVEGLRGLQDEIQVQSVSQFDDRLRGQLFRQIYGSDRFVHFTNLANPPVRIVVDRGHVTLTGYVPTRVDQALLGHIARSTSAFKVDNLVQVDGEQDKERTRKAPASGSSTD
jgi:hyperosmotically inducible periplasmic protein